jgi:hypothetical protein
VFHKNNGEDKKAAALEHSARTPNVSSIISGDATGGDDDSLDDFLDSMIHPVYFNSTSSLPDTTAAMVAPYNAAAMASSSTVGSFLDLPNYGFNETTCGNLHQPAVANSAVPIQTSSSYSSSWTNTLHPTTVSYDLPDQMARALNSPNFAADLPSSSVPGISQQNSLGRGSYGTNNYLTTSAAGATATVTLIGQAAAKNLGA